MTPMPFQSPSVEVVSPELCTRVCLQMLPQRPPRMPCRTIDTLDGVTSNNSKMDASRLCTLVRGQDWTQPRSFAQFRLPAGTGLQTPPSCTGTHGNGTSWTVGDGRAGCQTSSWMVFASLRGSLVKPWTQHKHGVHISTHQKAVWIGAGAPSARTPLSHEQTHAMHGLKQPSVPHGEWHA